jgi:hypothetical protein
MSKLAQLREELRPHGVIATGCPECVLFDRCGGFEPEPSLFNGDCFSANCCRITVGGRLDVNCDRVCLYNPRYQELLREIGGLEADYLAPLTQATVSLPRYVPLIHHAYRRNDLLDWPVVALDTYQAFKVRESRYLAVAEHGDGLRRQFAIGPSAQVILRGTGSDRCLERYWEYRRQDDVPAQMARLDVSLVIGPNYSHFLDVPRPDNIANRKRQLLCLDEMRRAGVNPVPHLNAAQPGDWRFWRDYLASSPGVRYVAVEFETGNKSAVQGRKVIDRMAWVQQASGRRLHPLIIGGTQYVEDVADRFDDATFIDSTPFLKAVKRQVLIPGAGKSQWRTNHTAEGETIDHLLVHNLTQYASWIEQRWNGRRNALNGRTALPLLPV